MRIQLLPVLAFLTFLSTSRSSPVESRDLCTSDCLAARADYPLSSLGGVSSHVKRLGAGEACVFNNPWDAVTFGHVAWGFQIGGTQTYVFGSTDDVGSALHIDKGKPNGFWEAQGTRAQMLSTFKSKGYTRYNCEPVANSAVGAATAAATATQNAGYDLIGNNCLDHTYRILSAYNAPGLPSPFWYPAPNDWFNALGSFLNFSGKWYSSPKDL